MHTIYLLELFSKYAICDSPDTPFSFIPVIFFLRANDSSPRLFLSKLEVIITFFELCGKRISHLWTLHIHNLSSWTLLKTQNFPLFSQNFLIHYSVIWFHQVVSQCFFFPQQNYLVMSVHTFSYKSMLGDVAPISIWSILKLVCTNVIMILKESFHETA